VLQVAGGEISRRKVPNVLVDGTEEILRLAADRRMGFRQAEKPRAGIILPEQGQRRSLRSTHTGCGCTADIAAWKAERLAQGAKAGDPFLTSQRPGASVRPLSRHTLRRRFLTACRILGLERIGALTIHHGRHTFISHALVGGRTLAEVRDAAGHSNVSVTSAYLHVAVDGEDRTGKLLQL
jgi:integrase